MTATAPARRRPQLAELPELATRVGMHGNHRHAEVGGAVCFDIIISVIAISQP